MKKLSLTAALILFILIGGCKKDDNTNPTTQNQASNWNSDVPVSWYNLELKLIKETSGYTPPIAARAIGYTGVALYQSVLGGMQGHHSLEGQLSSLAGIPNAQSGVEYNWAISANASLADIIRNLFVTASAANKQTIDSLENANLTNLSVNDSQEIIQRSVSYGKSVADAIFLWSKTDGGDQAYLNPFPSDYVPPVGPGLWVPTPPDFQPAMLPNWGNVRLMDPANSSEINNPQEPTNFSTDLNSDFYGYALEVYNTGKNLTDEQKTIALYWADGSGTFTPPGHLIGITAQLIAEKKLDLGQGSALLAKVGIALSDAGIICWKYKYMYNVLRPVTYIKTYIDPSWNTLIGTPPFPSFTSGHSSFSAAAAGILTSQLGIFHFTDKQKISAGFTPRSFNRFEDAANEAAISRLYGGIHYSFDNEAGKHCGANVASNVLKLNL